MIAFDSNRIHLKGKQYCVKFIMHVLFIIVVYCMSLLFIICNEAHHASRRLVLNFQEILLNVNLTNCDVPTQKEIVMFLVTIDKNPPIMNLDGFTNINRQLISANLSFMATYLVVLMQFKLTLLRQTGKKIVSGVVEKNATAVNGVQWDVEWMKRIKFMQIWWA